MNDLSMDEIYAQSIELITGNPDLTSDKIPDHLLQAWLSDADVFIKPSVCMPLVMVVFDVAHDQFLRRTKAAVMPDEAAELQHCFDTFNFHLSLEFANRKQHTNLKPLRIFDFNNIDSLLFNLMTKETEKLIAIPEAVSN